MKIVDFFYLSRGWLKPIMLGFLMCYTLPVAAEPPSPADFSRHDKLVLTLSDKWLDPSEQNNPSPSNTANPNKSLADSPKTKDTPIGCGMDVTPLANSDSSFANRVVGKCNLTLRY